MERTGTLEPQDKLRTKEEEQGKLNAVGGLRKNKENVLPISMLSFYKSLFYVF